jgi:RsiW-degrading membrane proteinase PrsW (M82 family)
MTEIKKNVKLSCAVAIFNLGFVIQLVPQFCLFVFFFKLILCVCEEAIFGTFLCKLFLYLYVCKSV